MPKKTPKKTSSVIRHPSSLSSRPSSLTTWLWSAPLKFTGLFAIILGIILQAVNLIFSAKSMASFVWAPRVAFLAMLAGLAFCVYKLIRWTPDDNLDQKSFAILNIAQSVISVISIATAGLAAVFIHGGSMNRMLILGAIALLLLIFISATWILLIKSIYCRARKQGVSRGKLLWSIPFGINLFWYSGFLIRDGGKKSQTIGIKSRLLDRLGDWITARDRNTIIAFLAIVVTDAFIMMSNIKTAVGFAVVSLLLMLGFARRKKLRDNIGAWYANFAVALNIGIIVALISVAAFAPKPQTQAVQEQIQITETGTGD